MRRKIAQPFDREAFLKTAGSGRSIVHCRKKRRIFLQGDQADTLFFVQSGQVKLTVLNEGGREAVIAILEAGSFVGEECLGGRCFRLATATAITNSSLTRIDQKVMRAVLREEPSLHELLIQHLVSRTIRAEEDLIDQIFNPSEKRLARALLLLSHLDRPGASEAIIPKVSQETLAEMIGTTRSRVSYFMNKFRKLGYLEYGHGLLVRSSLQNVVVGTSLGWLL